ncbi:MAG TPA: amino acid adenylation domain-containing protein, partial [Longimicrobium sp.]|nr:amino acid adenylation domain-containing protein [Longimicrobium sp.]
LGVSAASLCHLAWAQVLARLTGRTEVVFGTLLFGRMQGGEGADRVMGPFINTLPVRVGVGEEAAEAAVRRTHALLADLLRHEHASLALAQRCSGVAAPAPLFTSLLNYRYGGRTSRSRQAGQRGLRTQERTNYPVMLAVDDLGEGFSLAAQVAAPAEAERVCRMMHTALERLVDALELSPGRAVGSIDVLPEAERREVVEEWSQTPVQHPAGALIHELVEARAERTPDALAVVSGDGALTYRELDARANRLAHRLVEVGAGPEVRVGVCLERSAGMVVALLAVLRAGATYLPLDPAYPPERLAYMLADSGARVLVTLDSLRGLLPADEGVRTVLMDAAEIAAQPVAAPRTPVAPENAAYVIYTSGSTGRPKGVVVTHGNAANLLPRAVTTFGAEPGSAVLQTASMSFDASLLEVFVALLSGAALHVADREAVLTPERLAALLREREIRVWVSTPALLDSLAETDFPALRTISTGGERCTAATAARWSRGRRLVNMYGPTETTIYTTAHECAPGVAEAPPIGRPVEGARVYVLDARGEPAPVGVPGELYVGGARVARGYLDRPALTAERFVPDPFAAEPGARLYRTGDQARWRGDGELEYLGRLDEQVKVRGFRIELGEIEGALRRSGGVADCAVVAREDVPGEKRLVAYVVGGVEPAALRERLGRELPEYMVPAAFVALERLPLSPNGKLDRRALPAPEGDAYARRSYEAPLGEVEAALAGIWTELLRVERVGRYDDFFELGGHSLLAARTMSRLRLEHGIELRLNAFFDHPTLEALAAAATAAPPPAPEPALEALARGGGSLEDILAALEGLSVQDAEALLGAAEGS